MKTQPIEKYCDFLFSDINNFLDDAKDIALATEIKWRVRDWLKVKLEAIENTTDPAEAQRLLETVNTKVLDGKKQIDSIILNQFFN